MKLPKPGCGPNLHAEDSVHALCCALPLIHRAPDSADELQRLRQRLGRRMLVQCVPASIGEPRRAHAHRRKCTPAHAHERVEICRWKCARACAGEPTQLLEQKHIAADTLQCNMTTAVRRRRNIRQRKTSDSDGPPADSGGSSPQCAHRAASDTHRKQYRAHRTQQTRCNIRPVLPGRAFATDSTRCALSAPRHACTGLMRRSGSSSPPMRSSSCRVCTNALNGPRAPSRASSASVARLQPVGKGVRSAPFFKFHVAIRALQHAA